MMVSLAALKAAAGGAINSRRKRHSLLQE